MLKVTLDTNVLDADTLAFLTARASGNAEVSVVTVTARELAGTSFEVSLQELDAVCYRLGLPCRESERRAVRCRRRE